MEDKLVSKEERNIPGGRGKAKKVQVVYNSDPTLTLFLRKIRWTLEQNAHRMLLMLKSRSDLMIMAGPEASKKCVPITSLEYYTSPLCGPVPECKPQCRQDLRDPKKAQQIQWKCSQEFFTILIEHHKQGIAICEAKRKIAEQPFLQYTIYETISFLKQNMFDMLAQLKQHCMYVHHSPLLGA